MIEPLEMRLTNPGGDPGIWVFHNRLGSEAVCGLAVSRSDGARESACLLVDPSAHTQSGLYESCRMGTLYENCTTLLVVGALRPGDIAIDIGAHVGYYATLFRLAVGANGSVYAFEPMPTTYRRLLRNVLFNRFTNLLPLPMAVAEHPGTALFHLHPGNEGESSLVRSDVSETCQVQVISLDDLFADALPQRPRVMKLDAEGVEMQILKGGPAFFERHAPDLVICEINCGVLALGGSDEMEIRGFFAQRGYRCALINLSVENSRMDMRGARVYRYLEGAAPAAPECPYVFNLMFVRQGSGLYPADAY